MNATLWYPDAEIAPDPPYDRLVDGRTGVVIALAADGDDVWAASLCDTSALTGPVPTIQAVNPDTAGCDREPHRARAAAVGEAIERYCGGLPDPSRLTWASYGQLRSEGRCAVDPYDLALHHPDQLAAPGFPFLGLDRDTFCAWVPGERLDVAGRGQPVLVPAALTWLVQGDHGVGRRYDNGQVRQGPCCLCVPGGVAAGPSREWAVTRALVEVIERHALATAWYSGIPLPVIEADRAWAVPNRWNVPVVLAHHGEPDAPLVTGCAADLDVARALGRAQAEARMMTRAHAEVSAGAWQEFPVPVQGRCLETYLDRVDGGWDPTGAGLHGAVDITCHLHLGLDKRVSTQQWRRLRRPGAPSFAVPCLGSTSRSRPLSRWLRLLAADGLEAIVVDLTTTDIARLGFHVVRVLVPGLRGLGPTAFGFFGAGHEPLPDRLERAVIPHV